MNTKQLVEEKPGQIRLIPKAITDCKFCPFHFCWYQDGKPACSCHHPTPRLPERDDARDYPHGQGIPDWCPLEDA